MCAVSMVLDHYDDEFKRKWPFYPSKPIPVDDIQPLKDRVDELERLIKKARKYDEDNNQKDCPDHEKLKLIDKLEKITGKRVKLI